MSEAAGIVRQLHFTHREGVQTYLSEDRLKTLFIDWVGAITEWIMTVSKDAGGEIGVTGIAKAKFGRGGGNQLTVDLTDPFAQALILISMWEAAKRGDLDPNEAPGHTNYRLMTGIACLRHSAYPDLKQPQPCQIRDDDDRLLALQAARLTFEQWEQAVGKGGQEWLLILLEDSTINCACFMNDKYLGEGHGARLVGRRWVVFGQEQSEVSGVPLLIPYAAFAQLDS